MPSFSPHARKRMNERRITEDEVVRALNRRPDRRRLATMAGS